MSTKRSARYKVRRWMCPLCRTEIRPNLLDYYGWSERKVNDNLVNLIQVHAHDKHKLIVFSAELLEKEGIFELNPLDGYTQVIMNKAMHATFK